MPRISLLRSCPFLLLATSLSTAAWAQSAPPPGPSPDATDPPATFFEHSQTAKWWISGQANFVFQANGDFYAQYSGPHSFNNHSDNALSRVLTLFTGYEFTPNSQVYFDVEESGGSGLSARAGSGRIREPGCRAQSHHRAGALHCAAVLPADHSPVGREDRIGAHPLSRCPPQLPVKRLDIRFGKFSLADFFDNNIGGTDSHYQFLNWVIDNNGAYDYAADTRGYTIGAILELEERNWGLRFAETLMPKVANGPDLDADVARARAENIELELRPQLLKKKDTMLRLLSYVNHGNMGDYEAGGQTLPGTRDAYARCQRHGQAGHHQVRLRRQLRTGVREGCVRLRPLGME